MGGMACPGARMSAQPHRWGCLCVECANRGRAGLAEAQRVRRHNLAARVGRSVPEYNSAPEPWTGRSYYATGPRVPHLGASLDRYHAYDWQTQPQPGEMEYLR